MTAEKNCIKSQNGPVMLKYEVRAALANMKRTKVEGRNDIVTELLTVLDNFRIAKVTKVINEIYDSDQTLENLSRLIFIKCQ